MPKKKSVNVMLPTAPAEPMLQQEIANERITYTSNAVSLLVMLLMTGYRRKPSL